MVILKKYQNKKIAVYGMGKTGYSAVKTLKKLKAKTFCWDDNKKIRDTIKFFFKLNKFWLKKDTIDYILISPGIDIHKCKIKKFLLKNKKKIITDLDLFFEMNKNELIISITGTNGKSTTCKILEKILKTAKYNVKTLGNIGNPILSYKKDNKKYVFILEVSSYQLQYSKVFRSNHAAILNISPDHLERHKSITNYIKVKSKIFLAQSSSDYSYINKSNKHYKFIKSWYKKKQIKSHLNEIKKYESRDILKKIKNKYFESGGNIENLNFAYKISKNLKINDQIILKAINNFTGLPHRQETVFANKKLLCINDSKATSYDACLQSLLNYNKIYWIVGGLPKRKDFFNLKKVKKKIIKAYIIGKKPNFFIKQLKNKIPFVNSTNLESAISKIYKDLKKSKNKKNTILLSPAAASYDQFNNFESRGNYFKKEVINKFKENLNA
jgi:UDP-N-acetylmuramoylalanine--D-glutamate ligase